MVIDKITAVGTLLLARPVAVMLFCFIAGCLSAYPFKGMPPDFLKYFLGTAIIIFSILNFPKKSIITVSGNVIPLLLKKYEISEIVAGSVRIVCLLLLPVFFICGNIRMNNSLDKTEFKGILSCENTVLEGVVSKIEQTEYSLKVTIEDAKLGNVEANKVLAYIPFEYEDAIEKSDYVIVRGVAKQFDIAANEGEFNAKSYYRTQGYSLSFEGVELQKVVKNNTLSGKLSRTLDTFKNEIKERTDSIFGGDKAGIVAAVLFGGKSNLSEDIKELYNTAGIGHLLSISGLHISLIGTIIINLFKRVGSGRLLRGIATVVMLFCYCCMTGFGLSTKRAFIMFCILLFSEVVFRSYDMFSGLALAALIILYEEPLSMFGASFLLSFSATLGIAVYLNESRSWKQLIKSKIVNVFTEVCGVGLFIQLSTLPIMLWSFNEISLFSFFINLIVIPIFTYIVVLSIIAIAASYLYMPLGNFLGGFVYYAFELYELLCKLTVKMPFSHWCPGKPELIKIFLYYIAMVIILYIARRCVKAKKGIKLFKVLFLMVLLPLLMLPVKEHNFEICFLDVGQGDCIFFRNKNITCLVDCGSSSEKQIEEKVIIPFLKSKGVKELDYLFLTHADADHINGAPGIILSDICVNNLVIPYTKRGCNEFEDVIDATVGEGTRLFYMFEDNAIKMGDLFIECVHPNVSESIVDKNEGSMVLRVSFKEFDVLLTGDIGSETEKKIVEFGRLNEKATEIEVLKCAHHGSKYSSSEEFLTFVKPMMAIISCSVNNIYGHPHADVLERIQKIGANIYATKDNGQITIITDGTKIKVSCFTP